MIHSGGPYLFSLTMFDRMRIDRDNFDFGLDCFRNRLLRVQLSRITTLLEKICFIFTSDAKLREW